MDGGRWADWLRLDLQAGFQHESNGKSGADSRSLNMAYVEPKVVVGNEDGFQFSLAPRAWTYVGGLDENPDIKDFRGYVGLRSTLGWANGLLLSGRADWGTTRTAAASSWICRIRYSACCTAISGCICTRNTSWDMEKVCCVITSGPPFFESVFALFR